MKYKCYMNNMISYICKNEYSFFFLKSNVIGVGCGYKVKNGFYTCQKCIVVFVTRKLPSNSILPQNLVPAIYKGIPTDVVESGPISIDINNVYSDTNDSLKKRIRPVLGGYSISAISHQAAGTMACLVTDNHDNFILSCNHVLAKNNTLPLGTFILQPGVKDGGKSPQDIVASLSEYIPINFSKANLVDCAMAKVINKKNVSSEIALVGNPKGMLIAKIGQPVKKVGRSTGLTKGKINAVKTTFKFHIKGKEVIFKNQIIATKMLDSGDSGSLLLTEDNYVLGLFMAGSDVVSIANTISDVLGSLHVLLVIN